VICDRFFGSTLAYQGAGRGLSAESVRALHGLAVGGILPDVTVLLDLDPEQGLARSRRRLAAEGTDEGRFEALDIAFHRRVRSDFLAQAARDPDRHIVIDAGRGLDLVQAEAIEKIKSRGLGAPNSSIGAPAGSGAAPRMVSS
jgi:dTMP kinase